MRLYTNYNCLTHFSGEDDSSLGAAHMVSAGRTVPARFRVRFLESRDAQTTFVVGRAKTSPSARGTGLAYVVLGH